MHIFKNISADENSSWFQVPSGWYNLAGTATTLGGGTLKLQQGMMSESTQAVAALADDPLLIAGPTIPPQTIYVSGHMWYRGVLTGSSGASGVNLWLNP